MTTQWQNCVRSFYKELTEDDNGRVLVQDTVTGRVCLEKRLVIYHVQVYEYLLHHQNIHVPRVYAYWQEGKELVVVEELVNGQTLETLLRSGSLSYRQKRSLLDQILDGMAFLHAAQPPIIHRDLKPSNLMVTDDGTVKIIDYDAAKLLDPQQTSDTVKIGTEGYAAPEQYGFGKVDQRTDIYGLGITIREMFATDADMLKIANKASQLDPQDRYASVEEMRKDIQNPLHPAASAVQAPTGKQDPFWKRLLFHIPGIRNKHILVKFLSLIGYGMLLDLCLSQKFTSSESVLIQWVNKICALLCGLFLIDLFFDWVGIYKNIPWLSHKNPVVRVAAYILLAAVTFFGWIMFSVILEQLLGALL